MAFPIDILRMVNKASAGISLKGFASGYRSGGGASSNTDIDLSSLGLVAGDVIIVLGANGLRTSSWPAPHLSLDVSGSLGSPLQSLYSSDTKDINAYLWAFRVTGADKTLTVDDVGAYHVIACSGVNAATMLDVALATATGTNSDLADPPGVNPVTNGAITIGVYAGAQATSRAWTKPSGLTTWDSFTSPDAGCTTAICYMVYSTSRDPAPPTGGDSTTRSSNSWAGFTLVLRPA